MNNKHRNRALIIGAAAAMAVATAGAMAVSPREPAPEGPRRSPPLRPEPPYEASPARQRLPKNKDWQQRTGRRQGRGKGRRG